MFSRLVTWERHPTKHIMRSWNYFWKCSVLERYIFYQLIPPNSPSPWIMSSMLSNLTSDVCMDFVSASSLITNQLQVLMSYLSVCILEQDPAPVPPALKTKEDVLLFFKLYNPEKEELKWFLFLIFWMCWDCSSQNNKLSRCAYFHLKRKCLSNVIILDTDRTWVFWYF